MVANELDLLGEPKEGRGGNSRVDNVEGGVTIYRTGGGTFSAL